MHACAAQSCAHRSQVHLPRTAAREEAPEGIVTAAGSCCAA